MEQFVKSKEFYNKACGIKKIEDDILLIPSTMNSLAIIL